MFRTLMDELHTKLTNHKGLLICGKGYPDTNARGLLCKVCSKLSEDRPIFALVDHDVSVYIYIDIKCERQNSHSASTFLLLMHLDLARCNMNDPHWFQTDL